jgi:hypothetical protein
MVLSLPNRASFLLLHAKPQQGAGRLACQSSSVPWVSTRANCGAWSLLPPTLARPSPQFLKNSHGTCACLQAEQLEVYSPGWAIQGFGGGVFFRFRYIGIPLLDVLAGEPSRTSWQMRSEVLVARHVTKLEQAVQGQSSRRCTYSC